MRWFDRIIVEEPRIRPGSPTAYTVGLVLVAIALGMRLAFSNVLAGAYHMIFLPAIIVAALIGGWGPGILAILLSAVCAWRLPPPRLFSGGAEATALALFVAVAVFVCLIIYAFQTAVLRLREERRKQEEFARTLEQRVAERTKDLQAANRKLRDEIAQREKAEAAVRQAQKMEAIGQLTGGVAHDFNNLLTVIFGNLDALRVRFAGRDPSSERLINGAVRGAERAASLIQRLLAFARRQTLEPTSVDVNKLVLGMSELIRRSLGEQIEVETVLAGGLWRALCDPHQLEVALLNLVVNARDAMPNGGKLTIETANASLDEVYAANHDQVVPGQYVMAAITDTGTGMSSEVAAKAFEPFFTTKQAGHGTGLGLSMVYGFLKQSGGHAKIYSEPGHGTTVKLYIPRLVSGIDEPAAPLDMSGGIGGAGSTILVVEDDDQVRDHAARVLRELGYRVLEASNGAEALAMLQSDAAIDLLFTDMIMPAMNGRELADAARRVRKHIKVVFTTGYSRNALLHGGRLAPGVRLVPKPFTAATLAVSIRNALTG